MTRLTPMRVLVIDDSELLRVVLMDALKAEGCSVTTAANGRTGLETLQAFSFDCVVTDLRMPEMDGWKVLRWIREHQPDVDTIVLTGHGEVQSAVEAMKAGAWDFLVKDTPLDVAQVKAALAKLTTVRALRRENLAFRLTARLAGVEDMVPGTSPAWKALMETAEKVAGAGSPILIQGETGSGKELVARTLHQLSPRRDAPFLALNCGAISGQLLESELFGYEKGAFTGAATARSGLLAAAEGGTLFLDEISEMSGAMQVSLLRVLDRGEYRQVGGTRILLADVRFVAASNRDLTQLVADGRFREDLLYRINTVTLRVPPLRDRAEDIPGLARHFLDRLRAPGAPPRAFSPPALTRLSAYRWPGNVRELRNVVERLILLSPPGCAATIEAGEVAAVLQEKGPRHGGASADNDHVSLEAVEKAHILKMLQAYGGNKTQTARALGIDYKTLLSKLARYGPGQ